MFLYIFYIQYIYNIYTNIHVFIYIYIDTIYIYITTHVFFFFLGGMVEMQRSIYLRMVKWNKTKRFVGRATLAPDSTASLTNERFLLRLDDSGLDGGGKLRCVRGRECTQDATEWGIGALYWIELAINTVDSREVPYDYSTCDYASRCVVVPCCWTSFWGRLDLSSSSAIAYQYGFVQPAEEDGCSSCLLAWNNSNLTDHGFASFDFGMSGDVIADLGMQLKVTRNW